MNTFRKALAAALITVVAFYAWVPIDLKNVSEGTMMWIGDDANIPWCNTAQDMLKTYHDTPQGDAQRLMHTRAWEQEYWGRCDKWARLPKSGLRRATEGRLAYLSSGLAWLGLSDPWGCCTPPTNGATKAAQI